MPEEEDDGGAAVATRALSLLLLACLIALPANGFAQSQGLKKIHVGVPAVSMGNIVIFVAKEAKLFVVDSSFVEELDKSGFIRKLYDK